MAALGAECDGGFGESCASYNDPALRGHGAKARRPQTAWGLLGLLTVCDVNDPAVQSAVAYLLERQNDHGSWDEGRLRARVFRRCSI